MNNSSLISICITQEDLDQFKRLDTFLTARFPEHSRNLIKKLFADGHITSDVKIELKKMPKRGTEINFIHPIPVQTEIIAQDIPLNILFEDEYLLIINKPAGLVVHPAPGNYDGTLVNAILFHCHDLQGIGNEMRPGIVHRLDKGTSGVMVVAKEQRTHEALVKLFSTHDIDRKYEAICLGTRTPANEILTSIIGRNPKNRLKMTSHLKQGKEAITQVTTLEVFEKFSHVELKLETGRTHQIRVHLSELVNSPILNDHTYGKIKEQTILLPTSVNELININNYEYPFLHAKRLGFTHPMTQKKLLFETPPPDIFQEILQLLRTSSQ